MRRSPFHGCGHAGASPVASFFPDPIPFVLYGPFRYLYLVHVRGDGGSPEEVLLRDRPMTLCVVLWALAAAAIIYLSPAS